MTADPRERPPRAWVWLARVIVPADRRDETEGDLVELWQIRRNQAGQRVRRRFWRDAVSLAVHARRRAGVAAPADTMPTSVRMGLTSILQDVRFGWRLFRRQPSFAALALTTLVLGIASSTAIFTICDRVLLRPLPYPDPDRVVLLDRGAVHIMHGPQGHSISPPEATRLPEFVALGIYDTGGLNLGDDTRPVRLQAAAANSGFFDALGVAPLIGRAFSREEDTGARVVEVSFNAWRHYFNSDRQVLDRSIDLNGKPFRVVGVMPRGFTFPQGVDVWVPPYSDRQMTGVAFGGQVIGRLAPDVAIAQATEALRQLREVTYGHEDGGAPGPSMAPMRERLVTHARPTLLFLAAIAGLLLAAACANVAGLLLSRVRTRARELHVRRALGASRGRLARQLLTESLLLTGAGAIGGVTVAAGAIRLFAAAVPALLPDAVVTGIDLRFLAVGAAVSAIAGAVFSLGPVLSAGRRGDREIVREGHTAATRTSLFGAGLITTQTAAAIVLLAATSAALGLVSRLMRVDLGFHNDRAVVVELTLPRSQYDGVAAVNGFVDRLETRLSALPGVAHVGVTSQPPGGAGTTFGFLLRLEHDPAAAAPPPIRAHGGRMTVTLAEGPYGDQLAASPDYFRAIGVPLLHGRFFTRADSARVRPVAILSESAARAIGPQVRSLIGKRLAPADVGYLGFEAATEIVGIVGDVRLWGATGRDSMQVYLPIPQSEISGVLGIAVDGTAGADVLVAAVRQALRDVDPHLPVYNIQPIADLRARFLATERLMLALAAVFSVMALVLVAIGLYGVLAQFVAQRTREIGIRMALGADRARLRRGIVFSGLRMAIGGAVVGMAIVGLGWRAAAGLLPGLDAPNVATLTGDALILLAVAGLAAWIPARRASSVDPTVALRAE